MCFANPDCFKEADNSSLFQPQSDLLFLPLSTVTILLGSDDVDLCVTTLRDFRSAQQFFMPCHAVASIDSCATHKLSLALRAVQMDPVCMSYHHLALRTYATSESHSAIARLANKFAQTVEEAHLGHVTSCAHWTACKGGRLREKWLGVGDIQQTANKYPATAVWMISAHLL
jgi:hypothetical protein